MTRAPPSVFHRDPSLASSPANVVLGFDKPTAHLTTPDRSVHSKTLSNLRLARHRHNGSKVCTPGLRKALHRPRGDLYLPPGAAYLPRRTEGYVSLHPSLPPALACIPSLTAAIVQAGNAASLGSSPLRSSSRSPPAPRANTRPPTSRPRSSRRRTRSTRASSTSSPPPPWPPAASPWPRPRPRQPRPRRLPSPKMTIRLSRSPTAPRAAARRAAPHTSAAPTGTASRACTTPACPSSTRAARGTAAASGGCWSLTNS